MLPAIPKHDYRHDYRAVNGFPGYCRVRVYEILDEGANHSPSLDGRSLERVVVLISEPDAALYGGPSVTNNAGIICAGVVMRFALPTSETVFIEHYPPEALPVREPESFDQVLFADSEPRQIPTPGHGGVTLGGVSWSPSSREEVERLIGGTVAAGDASGPSGFPEEFAGSAAAAPPGALKEGQLTGPSDERPGFGSWLEEEHGMLLDLAWEEPYGNIVLRRVTDDRSPYTIQTNVRWSVMQHSPSGFEWNYGGSGPADLALNILNMFVPPGTDGHRTVGCTEGAASETAYRLHQEFKREFVAPVPWEGATLCGAEIRDWIEQRS